MAAHRYWRVYIAAFNGGSYTSIAEVELYDTVGGPNLATDGALASASGVYTTGYEAAKAFDASTATWWKSSPYAPEWLQYTFASPVDIVEHAITASSTTNEAPNEWNLQYSDDGVLWLTLAKVSSQTGWTAAEKRVFTNANYPLFGMSRNGGGTATTVDAPTVDAVVGTYVLGGKVFSNNDPAWVGRRRFLAGTVSQSGTPVRRLLRAYHRKTGELIGEGYSDATTGAFSFESNGWADHCYILAFDDLAQAPDYNAQIYDLVLPV